MTAHKATTQTVEPVETTNTVADTTVSAEPANVQVTEHLEDADKAALDLVKAKREAAIATANLAVSKSETADMAYNNFVLRLALKYRLSDGDLLAEDGTITRKS